MRQSFEYLPRRDDYFPKLKRGHGSMHPNARIVDGLEVRKANPCGEATCDLNAPKSKNLHHDPKANLTEWCEERGLSLKHNGPVAMMIRATGGR